VIDPRSAHQINRTRHLCERNLFVTFQEGHLIGAILENIRKACAKGVPVASVIMSFPFCIT
jgi:hypothetical protein